MKFNQFSVGLVPTKFMEEDDGGSGGVALQALSGGGDESAPEPQQTPQAPAFDPAQFAQQFGQSIAESLRAQQPQQQAAPLTLEDAKRALKWWEPDDAFVTEFNNMDTQKAALGKLRDGLTQQFYAILQGVLQERDTQFTSKYDPVVQFMNEQQAERREAAFNKEYPQLAHEGLKPVISAVIGTLAQDPSFKSKGEKEKFKAIASGVEAIIKQTNPNFKLEAQASQPNQGRASALPTVSSGAGGGGGTGGSGAPAKSTALKFL